jgi:hypothetical protein
VHGRKATERWHYFLRLGLHPLFHRRKSVLEVAAGGNVGAV